MQLSELPRLDRLDPPGMRRLVRAAANACERHVQLRSLVVIVERRGHARMASSGGSGVSRLEVGIAESRAFQRLMRGEREARDRRVFVVEFPRQGGSLHGLVRFESTTALDERERTALGIEALRLAVTLDAAESLSVGDCALPPDRPAAALLGGDGSVITTNSRFDALSPGAALLDDIGTTLRDRDALRRVLDESMASSGVAHAVLRIGPSARAVTVRAASPVEEVALVMIVDGENQAPVAPHPLVSRLPHALLDRASLAVLGGNEAGRLLFENVVDRLAPRARITFLEGMVEAEVDPSWVGPLPLLDGGTIELAVIASEHDRRPAVIALAAP